MSRASNDMADVSATTIAHYELRAAPFWEATRNHDVSQNIAALLRYLPQDRPSRILDFGCGPGRDLAAFRRLGHEPVGLEGSATFASMAREHSRCKVWVQDFLALELPAEYFDGVFANASLFHVPGERLPAVLRELHETLRPGGILFASNPRGDNREGWNNGRYGRYHDLEGWRAFMEAASFAELEHYYRPDGVPRERQHWLASVWRRVEKS